MEQYYSFRVKMHHCHIVRNRILGRKQWIFSFKKKFSFGTKILIFGISDAEL